MPRIRTIKPEAFESEDLASVSVTAERTFFGLLTQADDAGRFRDNAAVIAGRLWALRPEHTATHVARDLEELAAAGLICRYTGCDGRAWLHIVTWDQHQKISKSTASRVPGCPRHQSSHRCGRCQTADCRSSSKPTAAPATVPGDLRESSRTAPGDLHQPLRPASTPGAPSEEAPREVPAPETGHADAVVDGAKETAGQTAFQEDSRNTPGDFPEGSGSGSRIMDPGSFLTGREAPAPAASPASVSAKDLVAEYVRGCSRRPPEDFLGLLGRKINVLLDERFAPEDIRVAMDRLRAKGLHASLLPSLVNEVVNAAPDAGSPPSSASGAGPWASNRSAYTPYLNPTQPEPTTFGGRL
ncbi:hypothetical protein ACH4PU_35230 [Streptomyces sp. NPDC021100]|uniref:hypothetical protein n=1 Tax=Streptomyces sp. NPDC021100 TaxID=3365114 RepID=UPI0037A24B2F